MPRLIFTQDALEDLVRLRAFLTSKNPLAAEKAKRAIVDNIRRLPEMPNAHRPVEDAPYLRDLLIPFGTGGYIARYRYGPDRDIVILRIRHHKEAGFGEE